MRACKAALGKTRLSAVLTQRQPACNGSWLALSSINMGHAEYACTHLRLPIVSILSTGAWRSKARSEEHTSELQSLMRILYAVVRLKKQKTQCTIRIEHTTRQHRIQPTTH